MGFYAQYSILPYVKGQGRFYMPDGSQDSFSETDVIQVRAALKQESLSKINKDFAKKLQNALNTALKENEEQYFKLVNKIINQLGNANLNRLMEEGIFYREQGTIKLNEVKRLAPELEKLVREIAANISTKYTDEDTLEQTLTRINSSMNKIRGDIFENLLADLLSYSKEQVSDLVKITEKELTDLIIDNLTKYSKGSIKVVNISSRRGTKVTGADLKKSLSVSINNNGITVAGSQGKTDVAINGLAGDFIGISAKNYLGSKKISLLSGANVVGLITQ